MLGEHQGQIFLLTLRISTLFIMILQGRRGPKSAEQQQAKTQSEKKYLALVNMGDRKLTTIDEVR